MTLINSEASGKSFLGKQEEEVTLINSEASGKSFLGKQEDLFLKLCKI